MFVSFCIMSFHCLRLFTFVTQHHSSTLIWPAYIHSKRSSKDIFQAVSQIKVALKMAFPFLDKFDSFIWSRGSLSGFKSPLLDHNSQLYDEYQYRVTKSFAAGERAICKMSSRILCRNRYVTFNFSSPTMAIG